MDVGATCHLSFFLISRDFQIELTVIGEKVTHHNLSSAPKIIDF